MTTLFISDLHLDASRPDVTSAFVRFMEIQAPGAESLYILGDFFEVWIGDDDRSEFNQLIVRQLRQYTDSGGNLFMMVGNRDFLMGEDFAAECGAQLLADPTVIDLYGRPTLLTHGDSLCTKDTEYMAFRAQARSPEWQQNLLAQPIEARREIARQLRAQSKSMNSMKAEDIMDVTQEEVVGNMERVSVRLMIHGHTHRPDRHPLQIAGESAERIVLGDWHDHLWWLQAETDGNLQLNQAPIAPIAPVT
ncbi:UDP-2,3-diacylglucosamine diphosphatase [Pseudomaricurvus alkylphenolicus]|uniref:UDP-2,3-diacylglucosamine diphosphatase n=1 Tax=Pseudomaricurvus alkylphenolicus TaxID=1306991 RepID=UPI001424A4C8|nr:UDP-2,3-diacylglucosamine diphosphatase [Pseudomaricurvus alkylphenolicus]NIB43715.1 UDP-2,3-diacylglucosamine diphosphatase [Pseudomaricurvus alkylphenolicus]